MNTTTVGRLLVLPCLAVIACGSAAVCWGQTPPQPIDVDDPRPLAKALALLESRYGWSITYEDPPVEYAAELADVTATVRKDKDRSKRVFIPRGGRFRFEYSHRQAAEPGLLLESLVNSYNKSDNSGEFRLVRTNDVFHVLPWRSRNADGALETRDSLLDTSITISGGSRTAYEMLQAILTEVSRTTGTRVGLGTIPLNLLIQTRAGGGVQHESARTAIMRTIQQTDRKLVWRLFCDPAPSRVCAFNLHIVTEPRSPESRPSEPLAPGP